MQIGLLVYLKPFKYVQMYGSDGVLFLSFIDLLQMLAAYKHRLQVIEIDFNFNHSGILFLFSMC